MSNHPWDFAAATQASEDGARKQRMAEQWLINSSRAFAQAEEAYRVALAKRIVELHDEDGVAWSVAPDLARGDVAVAGLRRVRDIAEGVKEAATQAAWRAAADRRSLESFIRWSMAADLRDEQRDVRGVAA